MSYDSGNSHMDESHRTGEPPGGAAGGQPDGHLHGARSPEDSVPAYRTVRVAALDDPLVAMADAEAWTARERYPQLLSAGAPSFGVVREREQGGWELLDSCSGQTPQDARDSMGSQFRRRAQEAGEAGDQDGYDACMRAAERMEWEKLDELTVLGERYRVVRAEAFIRSGPEGPEPPRISDPDLPKPGRGHERPCPTTGFVLDPARPTGMSEGVLKVDLLSLVRPAGAGPRAIREDSVRATRTHPGGVLLPATFMTAEQVKGRWRPDSHTGAATPQHARDSLTFTLRVMIPWEEELDAEGRAPYNAAADRFDAVPSDDLEVAGRHFRIVRVERLVRFGPDGPEGPRPSDPDPQQPVMVQDRQLRAQGLISDDEDDAPVVLDEHTQRLADLFHEEEARLRVLRDREKERTEERGSARGEPRPDPAG
ncbi:MULTISPECIES: DUF5954 family protein [unclassified Streptomyces]|uniref:DUF5954 family protein n=1 Tax=unclassified Streptomyces TaxID=2593676 RepID=UPI000AA34127|nr:MULTISPECIES: DUF5954 family protein [unclassified Streptomyces]